MLLFFKHFFPCDSLKCDKYSSWVCFFKKIKPLSSEADQDFTTASSKLYILLPVQYHSSPALIYHQQPSIVLSSRHIHWHIPFVLLLRAKTIFSSTSLLENNLCIALAPNSLLRTPCIKVLCYLNCLALSSWCPGCSSILSPSPLPFPTHHCIVLRSADKPTFGWKIPILATQFLLRLLSDDDGAWNGRKQTLQDVEWTKSYVKNATMVPTEIKCNRDWLKTRKGWKVFLKAKFCVTNSFALRENRIQSHRAAFQTGWLQTSSQSV